MLQFTVLERLSIRRGWGECKDFPGRENRIDLIGELGWVGIKLGGMERILGMTSVILRMG